MFHKEADFEILTSFISLMSRKNIYEGEFFMKALKILSLSLVFIHLFSYVTVFAQSKGWYIIKNGRCAPGFPDDAEVVSDYGGYYIDKISNESGEKVLYLTFDAGYENGNIAKILDVMKAENVKGAFFILSNLINKNPDLVKRIADEGHLVCNHTSNHKDVSAMKAEDMLSNIRALEEKYEECTGMKMEKIFRFPEGKYSKCALQTLYSEGYSTVFWSMAYDDWDNSRQMSSEKAINKLMSTTHEGAIILLHPTSKTNAEILPCLIREWKAEGYSFGSLKDLCECKN